MPDTNGKALVEHWSWAAEKGLMNKNTAGGLRAACSQVLSIQDDPDSVDIKTLDIEHELNRWVNLRAKDFKPEVLDTYKQRFRRAVALFLEYLADPAGWKPQPSKPVERTRADKPSNGNGHRTEPTSAPVTTGLRPQTNMIEYPFVLHDGEIARLILSRNMNTADVKRLSAFLATLVVDVEPAA